jgi:hypothetical protein
MTTEPFVHKIVPGTTAIIHSAHDYSNYDDIIDNYSEYIQKESCFTCKHYDYGMGIHPKCHHECKLIYDTTGNPQCFSKRRMKFPTYWEPDDRLTIEYHIKKHDDLNDCKPSDTYDIYMYDHGGTREKWIQKYFLGIFEYDSYVQVPNQVYYIVKNNKYYYCGNSKCKGFIPLPDFNRVVGSGLLTWDDKQIPIDFVERWIYKSRKNGELVYTTTDPLEDKFKNFEANLK